MKLFVSLAALFAFGAPVHADATVALDGSRIVVAVAAPATEMIDGEIRKVDRETKKITIKHGDIKSLEMPAMTMVFQVKDPAMLDQVKAGDKVQFRAAKVNGAFTVMEIEVVK